MMMLRRTLAAIVVLMSVAGFQSTASALSAATVSPPTHSVTGCCYVYFAGMWICKPC